MRKAAYDPLAPTDHKHCRHLSPLHSSSLCGNRQRPHDAIGNVERDDDSAQANPRIHDTFRAL